MNWKPIESAPKNGEWILVWAPHGFYVVAWLGEDMGYINWWHVEDNKHGPFPLRGASPVCWTELEVPQEFKS